MKLLIVTSILFSSLIASADIKTCKAGFDSEGMSFNMIRGMIPNSGMLGKKDAEKNDSVATAVFKACLNSTDKEYILFGFYSALANTMYSYECNSGAGACDLGSPATMSSAISAGSLDSRHTGSELHSKIGTWTALTFAKGCPTVKRTQKLCTILEKAVLNNNGVENKKTLGESVLNILSTGF